MRCVALTGGIASGKSTVAAMLGARGAAVVDADLLAREVVRPGEPALAEVVRSFGSRVLQTDGQLDRAELSRMVFENAEQRQQLERILHPRITALMDERLAAAGLAEPPLLVAAIPLLFELGLEAGGQGGPRFDGVLVVYAPAELQLRRLRHRDGLSEGEAARRLAAQLPIEAKRARASWVIDNSDGLAGTAKQVEGWWLQVVAGGKPSQRA